MTRLEMFIALRYMVSRSRIRFINIIGLVSVVGITLGVAALLIAMSVFNGFSGVVTDVLVGFDPHIRIEKKAGLDSAESDAIQAVLAHEPRVRSYAPFVSGKAMLVARSFNRVVLIRGVDVSRIGEVSGLQDRLVLGSLSLPDSGHTVGIIIGLTLADRLGSVVGDEIALISPYGFQAGLSSVMIPPTLKCRITGIYESNNKDYDANYAYISLSAAQNVFHLENRYSGIELRLNDFGASEEVKKNLELRLPAGLTVSTWYDLHRNLYSVMKIERWSAFVLLSIIIIVASFNMLGSLTMGVIEKKRDIGVLKTMGMASTQVIRIFMVEGLCIGIVGTLAGIGIGMLVIYLQVTFQIFPLDPTIYIIPAIPVKVVWTDFLAVAIASLGCSVVASWYPAHRAADILPADAVRWE